MTPLRVLICDDEPLALDRLGDMLAQCDDVEVIGTALSGGELIQDIAERAPDLILLDIEMPRIDGFDVVELLTKVDWPASGMPPLIVFVTAHPELAANAFDSGALDFISKPVRLSRLEQALQKTLRARDQREAGRRLLQLSAQLDELKRLHRPGDEMRHVWLPRKAETVRIDLDAIDWIGAEGEYVRFHVGNESYLQRDSLAAVAARLTPRGFVRIHRSSVVNPASIVSLKKSRWGALSVLLRSGAALRVGKTFRQAAKAMIE